MSNNQTLRKTLRRTDASSNYDNGLGQEHPTQINDDEEERRQARYSLMNSAKNGKSSEISYCDESESFNKCLEIFSGNKLNRNNVWSMSLIDSLSNLADRHHKTLNNFRVVGASLEASSKIYSLRVDSIHSDVLRMSVELNAQSMSHIQNENQEDDTGNNISLNDNECVNGRKSDNGNYQNEKTYQKQKTIKRKKSLKSNVTVTKNPETLNARLDTVSSQYPIFAKLNSVIGSIISPSRLLNNVLLTIGSVLKLCTKFSIWDKKILLNVDYTDEVLYNEDGKQCNTSLNEIDLVDCGVLLKFEDFDQCYIRPVLTGYRITNTPDFNAVQSEVLNRTDCDQENNKSSCDGYAATRQVYEDHNIFHNDHELSMAFDINAECEPLPNFSQPQSIVCVNYEDLDDLTADEQRAINRCGGLKEDAVVLDDLRPVDANIQLEYSYRPLDKISQFWAGPSYWKLRRTRHERQTSTFQSTTPSMHQFSGLEKSNLLIDIVNQRNNRYKKNNVFQRKKFKIIEFDKLDDFGDMFLKIGDPRYKDRKINFQKWDAKKLRLPKDYKLTVDDICSYSLNKFIGRKLNGVEQAIRENIESDSDDHHYFVDNAIEVGGLMSNSPLTINDCDRQSYNMQNLRVTDIDSDMGRVADNSINDRANNIAVSEISTQFLNAPVRVEQIVLPFAKRAKVIDMKNLKRCCSLLLVKEIRILPKEKHFDILPLVRSKEQYDEGMAYFSAIYKQLPQVLDNKNMEETSYAIAFYALLHLANEQNLHLFQQDNLKDFQICKLKKA